MEQSKHIPHPLAREDTQAGNIRDRDRTLVTTLIDWDTIPDHCNLESGFQWVKASEIRQEMCEIEEGPVTPFMFQQAITALSMLSQESIITHIPIHVNPNIIKTPNGHDIVGFLPHTLLLVHASKIKEVILSFQEKTTLLESYIHSGEIERFTESSTIDLRHSERILGKMDHPDARELQRRIQKILTVTRNKEAKNIQVIEQCDIFHNVSPEKIKEFGETIAVVQLTSGCSIGCPDCNFNSPKQVRSRLSFDCIKWICNQFGEALQKNEAMFYYASDPLDWEDEMGHTYEDVQNMVYEICGYYPNITTAVPKGKEELAKRLWKSNAMVRLSSSYMNDFEEEFFGTPGNPESHIIRNEKSFDSGLGYKGGVKYEYQESSTTIACQNGGYISPDGIHTICSTGTTPIYPNGFVKYPVSLQESTAPLIPHLSMIGFHLGGKPPHLQENGEYGFFPDQIYAIMEKIALGHFPEICGATRIIFRDKQYFDIHMGSPTSSTFLKTKKEIEGGRYKHVYRQYISDGDVQKYILLIKSFLEMYPETRGYFQNTFSKYELPILLGDNKGVLPIKSIRNTKDLDQNNTLYAKRLRREIFFLLFPEKRVYESF